MFTTLYGKISSLYKNFDGSVTQQLILTPRQPECFSMMLLVQAPPSAPNSTKYLVVGWTWAKRCSKMPSSPFFEAMFIGSGGNCSHQ
eukprot:CAMPEP_0171269368 /NCGR_PEP_ID=MMETSP0790-20130122/60154_1 /TAXON_ID=2925 /ORGANISM="Alexandrium catenella, Strain OF101" /LENGTH=86 /DNA_ID=CAMNT_0011738165 /DNA_START=169 /DNA_END=426 /DNA_ORIENTATION=+